MHYRYHHNNENEAFEMARARQTPEPEAATPHRKSTIFQSNASNPDFVPGYSVLRVEQVKHMTNDKDKTRLMNTIVDDIVASVASIQEYHQNGLLSDENVFQVSTMIQCMGQSSLSVQDQLEKKIASLKRQNIQQRQEYMELAHKMDAMGQTYATKVGRLEEVVRVLKDRIARAAWRGPQSKSEKDFEERLYRYLEEAAMNRGYDPQEQMVQDEDNADGEWEEDNIQDDGQMEGL